MKHTESAWFTRHMPPKSSLEIDPQGYFKFLALGTSGFVGDTRRRLIVTNTLVLLASVVTLIYSIILTVFAHPSFYSVIIATYSFSVLYLITPFLYRFGPALGALFNLTLWIIQGVVTTTTFGANSGLHFFFITGVASAILITGVQRNPVSMVNILLQLSLFIYFDRFQRDPLPNVVLPPELQDILYFTSAPMSLALILVLVLYAFHQAHQAEIRLEQEYQYSEKLLQRMLPTPIARRLKKEPQKVIADYHDEVSILFADIADFTTWAEKIEPDALVSNLNQIFTEFDHLTRLADLEKIKTVGDAFMVAGGMSPKGEEHALRIAKLAQDMITAIKKISHEKGFEINLRIGIDYGAAVAGVIGQSKPFYDVWGDVVNTAARMQGAANIGDIFISERFKELIQEYCETIEVEEIPLKGKDKIRVFKLLGFHSENAFCTGDEIEAAE